MGSSSESNIVCPSVTTFSQDHLLTCFLTFCMKLGFSKEIQVLMSTFWKNLLSFFKDSGHCPKILDYTLEYFYRNPVESAFAASVFFSPSTGVYFLFLITSSIVKPAPSRLSCWPSYSLALSSIGLLARFTEFRGFHKQNTSFK